MVQMVKNPSAVWETWVDPWVGKIPWSRAWQPIQLFLPGESLWTEEPGRLQSVGSQRVGHDCAAKHNIAPEISSLGVGGSKDIIIFFNKIS